jgi:hypothetical protein
MNAHSTRAVDYDVYDIGYLAGGPGRAVEAAIVALIESGRVAGVRSTGLLSVVDGRPRHWLEAAALDGIGDRGDRTADTLRWRLRNHLRFTDVRERLVGDGELRRSAPRAHPHRSWKTRALTQQGRHLLRRLRAEPPVDGVAGGTRALPVALSGLAAMGDASLRTVLFHPPAPPAQPRPPHTRAVGCDTDVAGFESYASSTPPLWTGGVESFWWGDARWRR